MKSFIISTRPYGRKLMVSVGLSKETVLKDIKRFRMGKTLYKEVDKEKKLPVKSEGASTFLDLNYGRGIIYLPKFDYQNHKHIGILHHEINHFGVGIMQVVGINIMKEDEPFCYATEEYLERVLKKLK